ncbi:MAG: hypothetical protein WC592_03330 [Candidatus Omnitrophota bacterium]
MLKSFFIFTLALLCGLVMVPGGECQYAAAPGADTDEDRNTVTIEGQISSIDWVGGVITVRWLQYDPYIKYDEITLSVPRDIKIMKASQPAGFNELSQFDHVTVKYRKDKSVSLPRAVSITVTNAIDIAPTYNR